MSLTLSLPDQYGLVLAATTATFFVNSLHVVRTSKFRKASGVTYPNAYASAQEAEQNPAAHTFNCAQRAHANFTENHLPLVGSLLIAGLQNPVVAASLGALWAVSRVLYVYGYTSSAGPKGRLLGSTLSFISSTVLNVMAAYTSYVLVMR